nr:hypothetical protein [Planococcus glaciei]
MKVKKMEAGLYCIHCKEEVDHEITYINSDIKSIRCLQCNRTKELKVDLKKRILQGNLRTHCHKTYPDDQRVPGRFEPFAVFSSCAGDQKTVPDF